MRRGDRGVAVVATQSTWAAGLAAPPGRTRDYDQRRSYNLVSAFATHRAAILRYMYDLDVAFTN